MFKILGRLLGLEKSELEYDKELLIFTLIGAIIFLIIGIAHTEKGAEFIYENRLNRAFLVKAEKEGISNKDIDKIVTDYKEAIPVNIIEYDLEDIRDNLKTYIDNLKNYKSVYLNETIGKLEEINKIKDKDALVSELKKIKLENMLKDYTKDEIVKKNLREVKEWQVNIFLSNVYLICGGLMLLSFIITKVVYEIDLIDKKEKNKETCIADVKNR
ncbi:MAG: hypothetical protein VB130_01080 [Clostridium sp.]|nr:hypothetical protein [Clostridium sp.]